MRISHCPIAAAVLLLLAACTTGLKQADFRAAATSRPHPHRTVVFFLVDGLAVRTLETGLRTGRAPNLRRFFLRDQKGFAMGQAAFPTQTYPNISSILTTRPVGEQPVIANHVLAPSGKILAYEDEKYFPLLRRTIDPISVIGNLNREGKETATFSFVFGMNATDHMRTGLTEGLEYVQHHFRSLDGRLLDSLAGFLRDRGSPANWPDFLYVHLVGIDGTSHRYGPDSAQTQAYLAWLDQRLGATFAELEAAEKHGEVVTMFTADHGFVTTNRYVPLSKLVRRQGLGAVILNEGRFLALHLTAGHVPRDLGTLLKKARERPGVELTALRDGSTLELAKGKQIYRFALGPTVCVGSSISVALMPADGATLPADSFHCPTDFDDHASAYPFLVDGISRYLTAPNHPDAIIVAKRDVSFSPGQRGSHGGPTAEESYVPILLRNAHLRGGENAVRTSELLKLLAPATL